MNDQPRRRRTSPFIVWPACLFFMVLFYLASLGPFMWLADREFISRETADIIWDTVYFPLAQLESTEYYDHPVMQTYCDYVEWFAAM